MPHGDWDGVYYSLSVTDICHGIIAVVLVLLLVWNIVVEVRDVFLGRR
jgi:uncharacterized membrane-anchored protein